MLHIKKEYVTMMVMGEEYTITPPDGLKSVTATRQRIEWMRANENAQKTIRQWLEAYVKWFATKGDEVNAATKESVVEYTGKRSHTKSIGRLRKKFISSWQPKFYQLYLDGQHIIQQQLQIARQKKDHRRVRMFMRRSHTPPRSSQDIEQGFAVLAAKQEQRINEDVIGIGDGWHVVCDGVGNLGRGVTRVMGEAVRIAAEARLTALQHHDAILSEQEIVETLRGIPADAAQLKKILLQNPVTARAMNAGTFHLEDFSTTAEIVYYSPTQQKVYVLHVGDSRTYILTSNGKQGLVAQQLTVDHEVPTPSGSELRSSINLFKKPREADLLAVSVQPGMRVVSVTDGTFNGHEMLHPQVPFNTILEHAATRSQQEMVNAVVEYAQDQQMTALFFDDTSIVSTTIPNEVQ